MATNEEKECLVFGLVLRGTLTDLEEVTQHLKRRPEKLGYAKEVAQLGRIISEHTQSACMCGLPAPVRDSLLSLEGKAKRFEKARDIALLAEIEELQDKIQEARITIEKFTTEERRRI